VINDLEGGEDLSKDLEEANCLIEIAEPAEGETCAVTQHTDKKRWFD
jgi:hypothetical protein